jgi:hypothetical protein
MTATSREAEWKTACANARSALEIIELSWEKLDKALGTLADIQAEYAAAFVTLSESDRESVRGEKLQVVMDLQLEADATNTLDRVDELIAAAEDADLPKIK